MTQTNEILSHLKSGKSISTIEAFELYRITRLAEYIRHLRNDLNLDVQDKWETPPSGKKHKRYWLVENESRIGVTKEAPRNVTTAQANLFDIKNTQHGVMM